MDAADLGLPPIPPRRLDFRALQALVSADRQHGCRVLDPRGAGTGSHLPGSAALSLGTDAPLPVFLLPPRGRSLALWAGGAPCERLARRLTRAGWPCSWCEEAAPAGVLAPGPAQGAAWEPDPWLLACIDTVSDVDGPVLDIACGSTREGVYLAQKGRSVWGIDRLPDALALAARRARHHRVRLHLLQADLERARPALDRRFSLVLNFRFFLPAVFEGLPEWVSAGGYFVLRTFGRRDAQTGPPDHLPDGPRRLRHRADPQTLWTLLPPPFTWIRGPEFEEAGRTLWVRGLARREG